MSNGHPQVEPDIKRRSETEMSDYPKGIKRLLREYLSEAYERELRRELTRLDESFAEWRRGEISNRKLDDRIHEYETGPARALYKAYNYGPADMAVAYAVVVGVLDQEEVPKELLEAIERPINFYRSLQERNELRDRKGRWWSG